MDRTTYDLETPLHLAFGALTADGGFDNAATVTSADLSIVALVASQTYETGAVAEPVELMVSGSTVPKDKTPLLYGGLQVATPYVIALSRLVPVGEKSSTQAGRQDRSGSGACR